MILLCLTGAGKVTPAPKTVEAHKMPQIPTRVCFPRTELLLKELVQGNLRES